MFELVRCGWCVAAFVHDEVLVEVPATDDLDARANELVDVMVTSMRRVCPGVPIACGDAVAMTCWSKDAEVVRDGQGRMVPWSPPPPPPATCLDVPDLPALTPDIAGVATASAQA